MSSEISSHTLNNYNLKIDDDEYLEFSSRYKTIAENANDCWRGIIEICSSLKDSAIKGDFADMVDKIVESYGYEPGSSLLDAIGSLSLSMNEYISAIDQADANLY